MKLTAATTIHGDADTVWRRTQDPAQHERWDLRFTSIDYDPGHGEAGSQTFRYRTRLGCKLAVEGWGETIATHRP